MFKKYIYRLISKFNFIHYSKIGYSVLNEPLYTFRVGYGKKKIFICAGTHANEWITSLLILKFINNLCTYYSNTFIFKNFSLYFTPIVNPDGINLVTGRLDKHCSIYKDVLCICRSFPDIPFPDGWKSNIRGVGLKNYQPCL